MFSRLAVVYRIYRHKCKRKMPVFKKGGPIRFVEVEDWETRAWNRMIRWNDKINDSMEAMCGALGNAVLTVLLFIWKAVWWTLTTIVKLPFKLARKYMEMSEWLNMWMSHDFETKVDILEAAIQGLAQRTCQRIGHYLWLAVVAVFRMIWSVLKGIWWCILALKTAVMSTFKFVFFCIWGIAKAIQRGWQLVVNVFTGICWYVGQAVISLATGIVNLPSMIAFKCSATKDWAAQLPIFAIRQRRQQAKAAKALEHAAKEREAIAKKAPAGGQQKGHNKKGQRGKQQHHMAKQKPYPKSTAATTPFAPLSQSPVLQSASSKASSPLPADPLAPATKKHAAAVLDVSDSDQDVINAFKPAPPPSTASSKAAASSTAVTGATAGKPAAGEAISNRAAKAAARAQARAASHSPPKAAASTPPKAAANSPPKPTAVSPVKHVAHSPQTDTTAELIKAAGPVLPEDSAFVVNSLDDAKSLKEVTADKEPAQADVVSSEIKLQKVANLLCIHINWILCTSTTECAKWLACMLVRLRHNMYISC